MGEEELHYKCTLDPDTDVTLMLYLFKNVRNMDTIRDKIVSGSWKCSAIKPSLVLDPLQVAVAANKAVLSLKFGSLITRSVYSEILYNLALTKNISQSLSKFGIEDGSEILVCFLVSSEEDSRPDILPHIEGELSPLKDLCLFTNNQDVKITYKLGKDKTYCDSDLLNIILSRIATKNFVSH